MEETLTKKVEIVLKGIPASQGIAIGPTFLFQKHAPIIFEKSLELDEVQREIERLEQAVARSRKELSKILDFAEKKL
ncbi:MAG: phosphoenolpyruvate--protein phosphotransferase, partial [Ignavibacteriales bacterium]|nr:phosphoenolpyruvate--protein phosphotransferase [Ignavibacteriales bacterium]